MQAKTLAAFSICMERVISALALRIQNTRRSVISMPRRIVMMHPKSRALYYSGHNGAVPFTANDVENTTPHGYHDRLSAFEVTIYFIQIYLSKKLLPFEHFREAST